MRQFLYHGSCVGDAILASGELRPNSFPEYEFHVEGLVLSLTRCRRFAEEYASQVRDDPPSPIIVVIDRDILRTTHRLRTARSMIFDAPSRGIVDRSECEEFVVKPIPLDHPAVLEVERLHPTPMKGDRTMGMSIGERIAKNVPPGAMKRVSDVARSLRIRREQVLAHMNDVEGLDLIVAFGCNGGCAELPESDWLIENYNEPANVE